MGVQVTGASSMHWCHQLPTPPSPTTAPVVVHHAAHPAGVSSSSSSSSSSAAVHSLASVFSSLGTKKYAPIHAGGERELTSPFLLGAASTSLFRSQSFEAVATTTAAVRTRRTRRGSNQRRTLRRVSSASLDYFTDDEDDEEFVQRIQELAFQLQQEQQQQKPQQQLPEEGEEEEKNPWAPPMRMICDASSFSSIPIPLPISPPATPGRTHEPVIEPPWPPVQPAQPEWPDEIVPAMVEKNANRVELPLSLRIIKEKKKRWEDGVWEEEAGDSAAWLCSVKKAFSSMVFMIRELQSYTLQLRQALFYEDLQGILERVQREMNSSFVWLFQQIFSCTPTLMVSVMLLLANFTVYSMGHSAAIAAPNPASPPAHAATSVLESRREDHHPGSSRFDDAAVKTFSVGRSASIGGSGGSGGGKPKPVAGATDDGRPGEFSWSSYRTILPDGTSSTSVPGALDREDAAVGKDHRYAPNSEEAAEEARKWKDVLDSVRRMKASAMDEALLDSEVLRQFVAPVTIELEPEDYSDYLRTELMYQQAVYQEPDNVLLLANFAQFLYLVVHDHDRAEYYFKRAVGVQPADPEALSRYANFLWLGKKDLTAAEETYLEAIAADPSNTVHAANYAHFLWNTGGEDTCFPLDSEDA